MNKNTIILVAVILIIAAGVGGFFGGMQYQKSQRVSQFASRFGGAQGGAGFAGRAGGNSNFAPVRGQVLSTGNNSITIKEMDGTSKIVVVSSTTMFVQSQKASVSDLKAGDNVMVIGTTNSDGSVTAQNVQINPQQFRPNTTPTTSQ